MTKIQFEAKQLSPIKSVHREHDSVRNRAWERFAVLPIRFWWHVKGYGTILGMMILVFLSMVYLYLHSFERKLGQSAVKDKLGISCK